VGRAPLSLPLPISPAVEPAGRIFFWFFSSGLGCTSLNFSRLPDSRRLPGKRIRNFWDRQHLFGLVDGFPMAYLPNPALKEKLRNDSTRLPKKIKPSAAS
jgi:hypothetical protein